MALTILLSSCALFDRGAATVRYRETVNYWVNGEIVSASGVVEVTFKAEDSLARGNRVTTVLTGDAILLSGLPGRSIYVTNRYPFGLEGQGFRLLPAICGFSYGAFRASGGNVQFVEAIRKLPARCASTDRSNWPLLIELRSDGRDVRYVDPTGLIESVVLEKTSDPVDYDVGKAIAMKIDGVKIRIPGRKDQGGLLELDKYDLHH